MHRDDKGSKLSNVTVNNNYGNPQYPLFREVPTFTLCVKLSQPLPRRLAIRHPGSSCQTELTITSDVRITRPGFFLTFDGAVAPDVQASVVGVSKTMIYKLDSENKVGFYFSSLGDTSETSWFPDQKMMVTVYSAQPVKLVGIVATYGYVSKANQRTTIIGKIVSS